MACPGVLYPSRNSVYISLLSSISLFRNALTALSCMISKLKAAVIAMSARKVRYASVAA